jgi:hypothetical protein
VVWQEAMAAAGSAGCVGWAGRAGWRR